MATFLDALADLLGDAEFQDAYRRDPAAWLRSRGAGDLTREDVEEAVPVLCRWVPRAAEPLSQTDLATLPPVVGGESDLDGAIAAIGHVLARLGDGDRLMTGP